MACNITITDDEPLPQTSDEPKTDAGEMAKDQRKELAETLHDGVMHLLTAVRLKLKAVERESGQLSQEARANLRDVDVLTDRALMDLTNLVRDLVDAAPGAAAALDAARDSAGQLSERLAELATAFSEDTGIDCSLALNDDHLRFAERVGDIILRSVGELLNNVEKHADANRVQIRSDVRDDGFIVVSVIDDGEGSPAFSWASLPTETGGFGLFSIQSRLVDFGAYAEIDGRNGFAVKLVLPDGLLIPKH